MVRILHVVSSMNRGGLETFLMNVYRNIDRNKIQFDFLVHTDKESSYDAEIRSLGGNIYSIPKRAQGMLKNRKALEDFFSIHRKYKIVHHHVSSLTYIEPLKVAKKYGVPIRIIHGHSSKQGGSHFHKYYHLWNQIFIKRYATNYFACSDLAAKWLYSHKQYKKNEFHIINNGIETDKFAFNENVRKEMRRKFDIEDKFVMGHVGRFSYPKNHDFLLEIFKAVHEKKSNSILLLVGDGELRPNIEKKCEVLGLKDYVVFTGIRSDISDLLQAMDIFVFPSHYEGLPVTLVEAQTAGLPCVVSDNITKQVKLTNKIEFFSLERDVDLWSSAICKWAQKDIRSSEFHIDLAFEIKNVAKGLEDWYLDRR